MFVLQMLQIVTEKLLEPVITLSYQTHTVVDVSQLSDNATSLLDFLLATLFHKSVNTSCLHGCSLCPLSVCLGVESGSSGLTFVGWSGLYK